MTVTISPKYQIVIPKKVREALNLRPGQKIDILAHSGQIYLIPTISIEDAEGMLPGIDSTVEREPDRDL
jgi:AbrB family looped-hinge helix DNA binding protein